MGIRVLLLILASVALSALAQIALKNGMSTESVQSAMGRGSLSLVRAAAGSLWVWVGMALYGGGMILWLMVLARVEVSLAYPFVGLGFILTMLLAFFFLGEEIDLPRTVGTLLVVTGITLISWGR